MSKTRKLLLVLTHFKGSMSCVGHTSCLHGGALLLLDLLLKLLLLRRLHGCVLQRGVVSKRGNGRWRDGKKEMLTLFPQKNLKLRAGVSIRDEPQIVHCQCNSRDETRKVMEALVDCLYDAGLVSTGG